MFSILVILLEYQDTYVEEQLKMMLVDIGEHFRALGRQHDVFFPML